MERLPEDVAKERLHHDIVTLLKEHHPRSPQMPQVTNPQLAYSQSHQQASQLSQATPQPSQRSNAQKSKPRRPKSTINLTTAQIPSDGSASLKRSCSSKKKKESVLQPSPTNPTTNLGMDSLNNPFDSGMYSGPISLPHFMEMPLKHPPPYEDCIKAASSMTNLHQISDRDANHIAYNSNIGEKQQQQKVQGQISKPQIHHMHPRQQSMPASFSPPNQKMTSAHSHHISPPHSSPQYAVSHNPIVTSPGKMRPAMPTSPTHIAALRHATASAGFEFPSLVNYGPQLHQQQQSQPKPQHQSQSGTTPASSGYYHHFPTPPHHSAIEVTPQHTAGSHDVFPTPSPESPGQWSSASPHSQSDWSEGVRSPLGVRSPHAPASQLHQLYQNNGSNPTANQQTLGLPQKTGHGSIYI